MKLIKYDFLYHTIDDPSRRLSIATARQCRRPTACIFSAHYRTPLAYFFGKPALCPSTSEVVTSCQTFGLFIYKVDVTEGSQLDAGQGSRVNVSRGYLVIRFRLLVYLVAACSILRSHD